MIRVQVNAIINNGLDFEDNHSILLTLYYRLIDVGMKDSDVIMLVPGIIYNIEYYKLYYV